MDNFAFGFTLTVVGMGGTMLSLFLLTLLIDLLRKIFPPKNNLP